MKFIFFCKHSVIKSCQGNIKGQMRSWSLGNVIWPGALRGCTVKSAIRNKKSGRLGQVVYLFLAGTYRKKQAGEIKVETDCLLFDDF